MSDEAGSVTQELASVRLLGPPSIDRDGAQVAVDTRKAVALLAYLALTGRRHSRDHLAGLLWPDADQARARSALRRTLSALNTALGGQGLRIERESLGLEPNEIDIDVVAFRRLVAEGDVDALKRAVEAHGGELLSGFTLRDSPEFDEWQLAAAEDVRRELANVLERLSSHLSDSSPDAAVSYAKRWVSLDALHEPAHQALMRLYAAKGDRTSALRQYRECVAVLERDLGVEPLEATTELYESIREERAPVERHSTPAVRNDVSAALPLVGRDGELDVLHSAFSSIERDGRLIVIGGEPGIGKTRLADDFIAGLRQQGATVLSARCHLEEDRLAFGVAIELLQDLPASRIASLPAAAVAEAARLVPEFAPDAVSPPPLDSPAARRRLFEGVADVLAAATATTGDAPEGAAPSERKDTPGVVYVDDAHWMDESSRDVLRFLVRRLRGRPLCVVVTWRTEEVPPAHPLRRMFADAGRDGIATGITLQRLSRDDIDELLIRTGASKELGGSLFEETAGVPFFLSEYLKSGDRATLPGGVRDLLASRVESVSNGASQVLAAAAVLGRGFDPRTVREASGRSPDEVTGALDELASSGLIAESDERYDFTHPKLREYVYEATTLGRRRLLHGRAAASLARRSRRRADLAALAAHHFERSGDEDQAAEHFRMAGDHAVGLFANAEALSHYRSALALGHHDTAGLHEAIGDLQTLNGSYRDAISSYEKGIALGADVARLARKLGGVHHRLGDWEGAETHFVEAELLLDAGSDRARVLADRSLNAERADRHADAHELATRALAEAQAASDERSLVQAHNIAGILASHRGDARSAREHLQASLDGAEALDDAAATAAALNNLALVLRAEGAGDLALISARRALDQCRLIGDRHREAAVHSNVADILRDLGRSDEAMEHLKASAAIFADVGVPDEPHPEIWKLVEW